MNNTARFLLHVNKDGPRFGNRGRCWLWTASLKRGGYGQFQVDGRPVAAHVWLWEQEHGPVPDGLELDHLCRNRACVQPSHVEPVTHAENVRRGSQAQQTHCLRNHPLSGDNIYIYPDGARECKTCRRERDRQRRRAAA